MSFVQVEKSHVVEAYRLLNKSIIRVEQADVDLDNGEEPLPLQNDDDASEEVDAAAAYGSNGTVGEEMEVETRVPRERELDAESVINAEEASVGGSGSGTTQPKKKKVKLSYDEYKSMSNLILMYMRREENRIDEEQLTGAGDGDESRLNQGLHKSEIINWWLSEIQDDIDSEAELAEKRELAERVIHRLIHVV